MEFDLLKLLTDVGGAAGVGIVLVIVFLNYLTKRDKAYQDERSERDKQWQDFFTQLNAANKEDTEKLAMAMEKLTQSVMNSFSGIADRLAEHDRRVDDRISAAQKTATVPRNRQAKG